MYFLVTNFCLMTSLKFISYQQEVLEKARYFIVNMTWLAMVLLAFSDF